MEYRVVFDATEKYPELHRLLPILLIPVVAWLTWHHKRSKYALFVACGALALFVAFGAFVVTQWLQARSALLTGRAQVVEGIVENYHPMPYQGHERERFTVQGVSFAYSDYTVSPGLNQTRSHGGPDLEGRHVRIHYLRMVGRPPPTILKVEVRR